MTLQWASGAATGFVEYGEASDLRQNATSNGTRYAFDSYASPWLHRATLSGLDPGRARGRRENRSDVDAAGESKRRRRREETSTPRNQRDVDAAKKRRRRGIRETSTPRIGDPRRRRDASPGVPQAYVYRVDGERVSFFRAPPAEGDDDAYPLTFALAGDLGHWETSAATVAEIAKDGADAFVIVGDLSYANGDGDDWDSFGRVVEPVAGKVPLMVIPGNHEAEYELSDGAANFRQYSARFAMPEAAPERIGEGSWGAMNDYWNSRFVYEFGSSYYAFAIGRARWVMLNSYVAAGERSAQKQWLKRELGCLDRTKTPWLFVGMHAPWFVAAYNAFAPRRSPARPRRGRGVAANRSRTLRRGRGVAAVRRCSPRPDDHVRRYSTNPHHQNEAATLRHRAELEGLLAAAGASAVFSGHVHAYERTHPICYSERNDSGIVYITVGITGQGYKNYFDWGRGSPVWIV